MLLAVPPAHKVLCTRVHVRCTLNTVHCTVYTTVYTVQYSLLTVIRMGTQAAAEAPHSELSTCLVHLDHHVKAIFRQIHYIGYNVYV